MSNSNLNQEQWTRDTTEMDESKADVGQRSQTVDKSAANPPKNA